MRLIPPDSPVLGRQLELLRDSSRLWTDYGLRSLRCGRGGGSGVLFTLGGQTALGAACKLTHAGGSVEMPMAEC